VFFAVDNADFSEDTADRKETAHGTVTAVYKRAEVPGEKVAPHRKIGVVQSLSVARRIS